MGLKEQFIKFCEASRVANEFRERKGPDDAETIKAYDNANKLKRNILEGIDENCNS